MAKAEILVSFIKSFEGKFVNHPNDKGKATMMGITIGTFRTFYGQGKSVQDLKNMTDAQWMYIFKKGYWDRCKADLIEDQSVANLMVDWTWGSGTTGIKLAQQVIGVSADGIVGPKTIAAINAQDASTLFARLWKRRKEHFEAIAKKPGQSVFLKGWLRRNNGIKFGRLVCNNGKVITW